MSERLAGVHGPDAGSDRARGAPLIWHETLRPGGLVAPPAPSAARGREGAAAFAPDDRFLVVMPTYDERENLPRIVPLVLDEDPRIEILVVDDNSPDGTGDLAEGMARGEPRLHVLRRAAKDGLGRAYLAGFRWALERGYRLVFEMDADLSHHPDNLPTLISAAASAEVVVGSRYVDGRVNVVNWPMSRLLISYFGSFYARTITGLPVRDATGGFNCFRREVLEALDLARVQSNGYAFQIELKVRAFRRGFRLVEVPIVFIERESGESKMSKRIVREAVWRVWWLRIQQVLGPPVTGAGEKRGGSERIDAGYYDRSPYFEAGAGHLTDLESTFQRYRIEKVLGIYDPAPEERVLDLGCGWGTFEWVLAPRVAEVVGVDFSAKSVELCERRRTALGLTNVRFVHADAGATGQLADSFDLVIAADLFEHVYPDDSARVVAEARRVLKRGGRFCIWTPHRGHMIEVLKNRGILLRRDPTHVDYKSMERLKQLLAEERFVLEKAYYAESHLPVLKEVEQALMRAVPPLRRRIAVLGRKT